MPQIWYGCTTSDKLTLTCACRDPRRDQESWHSHTQPLEIEGIRRSGPDQSIRAGHASDRSWNVIMESAVLIIRDEEEDLIPLRTSSERLVNFFDQFLPLRYIVHRMIIVSRVGEDVEVLGLDHSIVGQHSSLRIVQEGEIVRMEIAQILELPEIAVEQSVGDLLVVDPECQSSFVDDLENGLLW